MVAIAVGRDGLSQMLVASQVMLSIVLPFVIFPLVWLCADEKVMTVRNGAPAAENDGTIEQDNGQQASVAPVISSADEAQRMTTLSSSTTPATATAHELPEKTSVTDKLRLLLRTLFCLVRYGSRSGPTVTESGAPKSRSFKSHWSTTAFGYALFTVVTIANAYVLLMLMMGKQ